MNSSILKIKCGMAALGVLGFLATLASAQAATSLPEEPWGKDKAPQCVVCHSLEKNGPFRSAPNLWGIVDSEKARAGWFGYSTALKKKGGKWSEEELDKFFKDPVGFAPGTKKTMTPIRDDEARAALIDFLKTLKD